MTTATPPRSIPPHVRLDRGRPPAVDVLVLLASREIGRSKLPATDTVYSFGLRTSG